MRIHVMDPQPPPLTLPSLSPRAAARRETENEGTAHGALRSSSASSSARRSSPNRPRLPHRSSSPASHASSTRTRSRPSSSYARRSPQHASDERAVDLGHSPRPRARRPATSPRARAMVAMPTVSNTARRLVHRPPVVPRPSPRQLRYDYVMHNVRHVDVVRDHPLVEGKECCICLDAFSQDLAVVATQCNHMLHRVCLSEYLNKSDNTACPVCRADLYPKRRNDT